MQVIYMHSLYYKNRRLYHKRIMPSHYKYNTIQNAFMTKSELCNIHALYVLYSIKDIHYHDSIICGLYIQHPKVCMYMIWSALSLYLRDKEPISTNTYQYRYTCL